MNYKINLGNFSSIFAVPSSVVSQHIKICSGTALKVLLIILNNMDDLPSVSDLSNQIGYSIEDITDGINYWIQAGILTSDLYDTSEKSSSSSQLTNNTELIAKDNISSDSKSNVVKVVLKSNKERPSMERSEILNIVSKSAELSALIHEFQELTGKILTSADLECIVAMNNYYGLSADYILMVAHYCYSKGKCNMRYVERTAAAWLDEGIDTHEKVDGHIKKITEMYNNENMVKSAFGINDRSLISSEKKIIDKWYNEFKFDINMIRLAYERTIESIGKASFAYTDKILSNWYSSNIKTPQEAQKESSKRKINETISSDSTSYTHDEINRIINNDYIKN